MSDGLDLCLKSSVGTMAVTVVEWRVWSTSLSGERELLSGVCFLCAHLINRNGVQRRVWQRWIVTSEISQVRYIMSDHVPSNMVPNTPGPTLNGRKL